MSRKVKSKRLLLKLFLFFILFASTLILLYRYSSSKGNNIDLVREVKALQLEASNRDPIVHKILVVIYDVHELPGHTEYPYLDPRGLSKQLEESLERGSRYNGTGAAELDIQIVGYEGVEKTIPGTERSAEKYFAVIDQFTKDGKNLCQRKAAGEFDEVWIWSDRSGGLLESIMVGPPGTTWFTNGGPFSREDCTSTFHVMGLNYETTVDNALHSFAHRISNTISYHLDGNYDGSLTYGDNFFSFDGTYDSNYDPTKYGQPSTKPQCSGTVGNQVCWITPARTCGGVHYPPNTDNDYTYDSQFYATNKCIGWNPQKTNSEQTYNCEAWGCTQQGYFEWWYQRMPGRCNGMKKLDGKEMPNWWWIITKGIEAQPNWGCEAPLAEIPGSTTAVDHRFGVGGSCNQAEKVGLNVKWNYGWGNVLKASNGYIDLYNQKELECLAKDSDNDVLFTLGKQNYNAEGVGEEDLNFWLQKAKNDGFWSANDQKQFDEIKSISLSKDIPDGGFQAPYRMQVGYVQIPYLTQERKGGYFQIGNEPDIYQFIPPTMYATYYHNYYDRVKRYDPTAKITVGSLGYPDFNHPFKDIDANSAKQSNYPKLITYSGDKNAYPMYHLIQSAPQDKKEVYRSGAWLVDVSIKYKRKYGTNIPVDFWAIHPYPWPVDNVTDARSGYVGYKFKNYTDAVNDSINQMEMFQKVIALPEINQPDKPIWVTELSILNHNTITKNVFLRDQEQFQAPYLEDVIDKAISKNLAQKFFYFVLSTPQLNNRSISKADKNIYGIPVVFNEIYQPYPRNIQLPYEANIDPKYLTDYKNNKSRIGKITAFNFFHMQFNKANSVQLMSENFHIFYLEYPEGERYTSSNTKWTYIPPEKWAGSIDRTNKLQAFNTYWNPIRNKMVQQVIAGNIAYGREASCSTTSGCSWPKDWINYGELLDGVSGGDGKEILGFDSRIFVNPNNEEEIHQTVVVEGNKVFVRVNRMINGKRSWSTWNAKGVWWPGKAINSEILMDVFGSNPYSSNNQFDLEMFTFDPVRNVYKFYDWQHTWTSYLMQYSDGGDTPVLAKYKEIINNYKDTSRPVINTLDRNFFSRNTARLVFTVKGGDSGSQVVSYHYGVGSKAGNDFSILSLREKMSTENEVSIDVTDAALNRSGSLYLNVFTQDAYGNTSNTKSIKIQ